MDFKELETRKNLEQMCYHMFEEDGEYFAFRDTYDRGKMCGKYITTVYHSDDGIHYRLSGTYERGN